MSLKYEHKSTSKDLCSARVAAVMVAMVKQGYLAHKKPPPPLGPP